MGILERFSTYPSDLVGLLSFTLATVACAIAARRSERHESLTWNLLGFVNFLFVVEIYFGSRYRITEFTKTLLTKENVYIQLHGWFQQATIIVVTTTLGVFAFVIVLRVIARNSTRAAATITIAVLALFAIETISLHSIDAIFYRPLGPILVLGWIWAGAGAGTTLAALQSVSNKHVRLDRTSPRDFR